MKRNALYILAFIATLAFTGCHKHKDDMPSLNGVDGHITNFDGKDIHFSSSAGNKAGGSIHSTHLSLIDNKSQITIEMNFRDIGLGEKGNFTFHEGGDVAAIYIPTNPPNLQWFINEDGPRQNGTIIISTYTEHHIVGEVKQILVKYMGSTITIRDLKFNLYVN